MACAQFRCHISAACIQNMNGVSRVTSGSRAMSDPASLSADPEGAGIWNWNASGRAGELAEDLSCFSQASMTWPIICVWVLLAFKR